MTTKTRNNNNKFLPLPSVAVVILLSAAGAIGADCDSDSPCAIGSFCGVDGVCRPYSCENWYEFGNRVFTGYDDKDPTRLECLPIEETIFHWDTMGLEYRCFDSDPSPIRHGYNRKCTAVMSESEFNCYSIDPSTDFGPFLNRTESACSSSNGIPFFMYSAFLQWQHPYAGHAEIEPAHNETYEFNPEFAVQGTIWANYTVYDDTPISASTGKNLKVVLVALATVSAMSVSFWI